MVEYLQDCSENSTVEMAYVTRSLRIAAEYFVSTGAMPSVPDFRFIVPKIRCKKIIPAFTESEIVAVLKAIDRDDPVGKRNFAIIFLAVSTGLRAGDIVNLKLTNIDYEAKTITIVQGKTQKTLITPISGQLCNIIADYVLNGRPQTADKHIFVRHRVPIAPLQTGGVLGTMLNRLCVKADVKILPGRSFHSLRRTFGTWLAKSEISVRLISQMLGHVNLDSGKPYYSFKDKELLECAMSFADIPITERIFNKNDKLA
jgi:integrase